MPSLNTAIGLILLATAVSCKSPQKTTSSATPAKETESPGNPTLKKANYSRIDNQTFLLEGITTDTTYGYSAANAVKVGEPGTGNSGPANERSFLNALLGPDGQTVTYHRVGSCCPVKSNNGFMGAAMLDKYEVTYQGLAKPVYLYINMYDPGKLYAPVGFTYKK